MTNLISMSKRELKRYEIVGEVRTKKLSQGDAAALMGVTDRTIRRWLEHVKERGARGLVHGNRSSQSPRQVPRAERQRIIALIRSRYPDFGPTLAAEKLSPQAKGRVERLLKTLQDRLAKELRLQNISNVHDANRFLAEHFVPAFNRRYVTAPRDPADLHRRLGTRELAELPETLCRMETRSVQNDFTVSFQGQWYQILPTPRLAVGPRDEVAVREYPDGSRSFSIRGRLLIVKPIPKRPPAASTFRLRIPVLIPA